MKILLLADEPDLRLWDHLDRSRLEGVDLVISCGDLPAEYLSFITCFTSAPILYVHGNHDSRYDKKPPEGCICIEDGIFEFQGLRILGFGGSMRYKPGRYQYTDREMNRRTRKLRWKLVLSGGFDILVTHAPMQGVGDAEDLAHRGFAAFRRLVEKYRPAYFFHGHVHKTYDFRFQRIRQHGETTIVNAWTSYILEVDPPQQKRNPLHSIARVVHIGEH